MACYLIPRRRCVGPISATNTGSLVSSATGLASLTLPFTGVHKCILPWSQTLPETKKNKKKTNVACYRMEVRDFYETCVTRRSACFLTTFSSPVLDSALVDGYIPAGPPPLSDSSIIPLLSTRSSPLRFYPWPFTPICARLSGSRSFLLLSQRPLPSDPTFYCVS